jgi:hypothetical protein
MAYSTSSRLRLSSAQGSALINAIIAVGIVGAISAIIFTQTQVTDKTSRLPRVKSAMAVMESQVRALAASASSYNCQGHGMQMTCQIKNEIFNSLQKSVAGAMCPQQRSGTICGIRVTPQPQKPYFDPATRIFSARIIYEGSEVAMKPIDIQVPISDDTFHSGPFLCPSEQPLFAGYDSSGEAICRPVSDTCYETMNLDSPGVYISSLDAGSLRPHCKALSLSAPVGCPANSYLTQINFNNGILLTSCGGRKNAFSVFGYNPTSITQVAALSESGYSVTEPPVGGGGGGGGGGGAPPTTSRPTTTTTSTTLRLTTTTTHRPPGGGGGGGSGCFIAGTPILMADGSQKAVEQIRVGDQVLGFDEESKQPLAQTVTHLHHHLATDQNLHEIHLADGEVFTPNAIHPLFVVEQNAYFQAEEIKAMLDAGTRVSLRRADGIPVAIRSIVVKKAFVPVYNFEVEGLKQVSLEYGAFGSGHNYYAGGFLVHNAIYGQALGQVIQISLAGVPSYGLIKVKDGK